MPDGATLLQECAGYLKPDDVAQLQTAYTFSESAHKGQFRNSGEPYISHPLAVAEILAGWHLDGQALVAALLHDVMEDTSVTKAEISDTFGRPVAELVDGVSKLDKIEFQSAEDAQAENFRKMLLAMARDVRVILIKLADRLHNMRTLAAVAPAKRRRVARETEFPRDQPKMGWEGVERKFRTLAGSVLGTFAFAVEPNQSGPLQVVAASWLGGAGDEQIVGADVRDDQSVVLAINAVELKLGAAPVALGEAVKADIDQPAASLTEACKRVPSRNAIAAAVLAGWFG